MQKIEDLLQQQGVKIHFYVMNQIPVMKNLEK